MIEKPKNYLNTRMIYISMQFQKNNNKLDLDNKI